MNTKVLTLSSKFFVNLMDGFSQILTDTYSGISSSTKEVLKAS